MNIPNTPFKLNDIDALYDIEVQSTGEIINYKALYPDCDIKDCKGFAFYSIGHKHKYDECKGKIYTQNVCERHMIETINRLGIKEE
jgi:hypothetical protein